MKKFFALALSLSMAAFTAKAVKVDTIQVPSASMNKTVTTVVYTPTPCDGKCHADLKAKGKKAKKVQAPVEVKKYPMVAILHGAFGSYKAWTVEIKPNLGELADQLGMVLVCPDGTWGSWYWDSPRHKDMRYETFISKELVEYIDANYPTIGDRKARAITGLSMGGHGAMFNAMRHTDVWGAVGSMSGGLDIRPFPLNWGMAEQLGEMANNKDVWDKHTAINQISRIKNGDLAITFDCGESDFFLEVNKEMHSRLLGAGIDHDFTTRPGGHTSEYWANSIDYHLLFFKKFFSRK